jgi:DNA-directed RNA polymerase subunit RPC12/RpoP
MRKNIEVFEDMEEKGHYLVYGTRGVMEAMIALEFEYPETKGIFKPKDARECTSYKCLDCGSHWISDDVCGECGEYRLSKKGRELFYF